MASDDGSLKELRLPEPMSPQSFGDRNSFEAGTTASAGSISRVVSPTDGLDDIAEQRDIDEIEEQEEEEEPPGLRYCTFFLPLFHDSHLY